MVFGLRPFLVPQARRSPGGKWFRDCIGSTSYLFIPFHVWKVHFHFAQFFQAHDAIGISPSQSNSRERSPCPATRRLQKSGARRCADVFPAASRYIVATERMIRFARRIRQAKVLEMEWFVAAREVFALQKMATTQRKWVGSGRGERFSGSDATEWNKARSKAGTFRCSATDFSTLRPKFLKPDLPRCSSHPTTRRLAEAGGLATVRSNGKTQEHLLRARAKECPVPLIVRSGRR